MIELFYYFIFPLLSLLLTITCINAILGPFLKWKQPISDQPFVSVLIPARNEEKKIRTCLESLLKQDYHSFEIHVLDDESTDHTAEIVKTMADQDPKIHFHSGEALPDGWTGKNWACHQLSQYAQGEIFIFTDADNRYETQAITRTVDWMQRYHLGMLSVFPQQITSTFFEKLIVPIVDLILYSLLPLWLTYYTRSPHVAAANGQWIVFQREVYEKIGGHQAVRDKIVEDVELSRLAKRSGIKILTEAGTGMVYGYMYHSIREVWEGFSKNFFGLISHKTIPFLIILASLIMIAVLPYLLLFTSQFYTLALVAIIVNLLWRSVLAIRFKHSFLYGVILHPLSIMLAVLIGLNSLRQAKKGQITWKNRQILLNTK